MPMLARRRVLLNAFKLLDLSVMVLAFLLATRIAYSQLGINISFGDFIEMRVKVGNFVLILSFLAVWHLVFVFLRLYESRRLSSRWREPVDVAKASLVGTGILIAAALVFNIRLASPAFVAAFWLASMVLTILSRLTLRLLLEQVRARGRNLRHLLIVGTNERAFAFAGNVLARPELGYRLLGFVDEKREIPAEFEDAGYRVVADFGSFKEFLRKHVVNEVVKFLPIKSLYDEASSIVAACEEQGVVVRYLPNNFDNGLAYSSVGQFENEPIITMSTGAMRGLSTVVKRAIDVAVSLTLLILFAPLAAAVILAIKLTSSGPVHFAQERLGLNKRRFRLYKFRTMVAGAEQKQAELEAMNEVAGPVFKIKNDPRITSVGRILRKTSIDELPQLFNVLKGDMSLVGPRPLPVRDYEGFDEDWHRRRFSVRPGITCLWQVGGRSDTSFDKWMKLDMEYIDRWSLSLDLKILLATIPAVLKGAGAV